MVIIEIIIITLCLIFTVDIITGQKLINKYTVTGIFGKPGSGKSTLLTKMMYQDLKNGWIVYSDTPNNVDGVINFDPLEFKSGKWLPDGRINNENIAVYFDEMGILYNNREFKNNLNSKTLEWWKTHRHHRCKIVYGSQSYKDMDLKIRALSTTLYLCKRGILRNFTVAKRIKVIMDIQNNDNPDSKDQGGQIIEKYEYDLPIFWKFTLLPKWIKKFNSYR